MRKTEPKKYEFGEPISLPKAETWKPKQNQPKIFMIKRIFQGQFATSYIAVDVETNEELFLPTHIFLHQLLEKSGVKEGSVIEITCTREGSRKMGDTYRYVLRLAKQNPPF